MEEIEDAGEAWEFVASGGADGDFDVAGDADEAGDLAGAAVVDGVFVGDAPAAVAVGVEVDFELGAEGFSALEDAAVLLFIRAAEW